MGQVMGAGMAQTGALLLGRHTYEDFASVWPQRKDSPFVLGSGRRLFPEGTWPADLRLVDSVATTTGVVIATYEVTHEPEGVALP